MAAEEDPRTETSRTEDARVKTPDGTDRKVGVEVASLAHEFEDERVATQQTPIDANHLQSIENSAVGVDLPKAVFRGLEQQSFVSVDLPEAVASSTARIRDRHP